MRKAKYLVTTGLLVTVSMFASMTAFAHSNVDPIAGGFSNLVAGNGGLAWLQFFVFNSGI